MGGAVAGVPDLAVSIDDQVVRPGARIEVVALERTGLRVQKREIVALLADEPDPTLLVHIRITRSGALPGDRPLGDVDRVGGEQRAGGDDQARDDDRSQPVHGAAFLHRVTSEMITATNTTCVFRFARPDQHPYTWKSSPSGQVSSSHGVPLPTPVSSGRAPRGIDGSAHAQPFLSVQDLVLNLFRVGRILVRAGHHRLLRTRW